MKTVDDSEMNDALCSFQYMANIEQTCEYNQKVIFVDVGFSFRLGPNEYPHWIMGFESGKISPKWGSTIGNNPDEHLYSKCRQTN